VPYDECLTGHQSVYKLVITQFETDTIPDFHIKAVNKADHLITTSSFQPEIWRRCGIRASIPITVLTAGIDTDYFSYQRPEPDGTFKVLMLGALTGRKDPLAAIRIFQEASGGDPSWKFTIKTRQADRLDLVARELGIAGKIQQPFRGRGRRDPRIELIISDDPPDAVRGYYQSHDALLWPSKGEGVGLPPLEAMSCGMEVVMSNNSGMADYALASHCWPIPTDRMEPADGPDGFSREYVIAFGDVGSWWVPSEEKGARQLRRAFEAWKLGRGKGAKAAAYVRAKHTLEHQGQSVLNVVEQYAT
jgi:glycosyltransferase involved in cell wall biosynthesis